VLLVLILLAAGTFFVWNRWANPVAAAPVTIMQASNIVAVAATATDEPLPTATPSATPNRIQPKQLSAANSGARPTWTLTPTPTDTPIPTDTPPPTYVSDSGGSKPAVRPLGVAADERWIDVDLSQQLLVAYEGNAPIFETLISSGTYDHPTVTGQFRIWLKYEAQTMDGSLLGYDYYLENVPYVMYFYNDYALHGTFWHNNFGTPMSHGCVNMETSDAQWVFSWAGVGTVVNVHY
jgi:lipoprotein-anchoring transpeptidase ErfK/SrfK